MAGKYLSEEEKQRIRKSRQRRKVAFSTLRAWLIFLTIAAILLLNLFTHVFQIARYTGNGMEPNLKSGQVLLLRKTQDVEEGDIVAFYYNNQVLVRRVICSGGKHVSVGQDGTVSVNGQTIEEEYVADPSIGQCNISFPYQVQRDHYFVMGDNRTIAMDSRLKELGVVPQDRIIGKVIFVF